MKPNNIAKRAYEMAEIRRRLGPAAGEVGSKLDLCRECGGQFFRWRGRQVRYCPDCAAKRAIAVQTSMMEKQGEYYEAAVLRLLAYWQSEADRLGISND